MTLLTPDEICGVRRDRRSKLAAAGWDFLGLGREGGPPALRPRRRQRLRELLAFALERLPVSLPGIWDELLRFH